MYQWKKPRRTEKIFFCKYLFPWSDWLDPKRVLQLVEFEVWNPSTEFSQINYFLSIFGRKDSDLAAKT